MSVYKVIYNYYNDLLNFLSHEDSSNKGLTNLFSNITPDKKKIVVSKLAEMMVKFDSAFNNEKNYWKGSKRDQTWFMWIYLIMLVITFIIIIIFLTLRFKEIKAQGGDLFMKVKSVFSHLIVYQIILTIFLVLIVKVKSLKKLCVGQDILLSSDLETYSNYIFIGSHRNNMYRFFNFVGLWRKNPKSALKSQVYKYLQNDSSYNDVLGLFAIDNSNNNGNTNAQTEVPSTSFSIIETQIYDKLKTDIEASLIMFYNNGDGYIDIKKLVDLASPILMLKEAKRIMSYYKFLGLKKRIDDSDKDEKTKKIVDKIIVEPITKLIKDFSMSKNNADPSEIAEAVILNEKDETFKSQMNNLIKAFDYLAIFAYPVYVKTSDKSSDFPLPTILQYMPNKIVFPDNTDKKTKEFLQGIKTVFSKIYDGNYHKYIENASKFPSVDPIMKELLIQFIPLYNELFYKVFLNLQGGIWFPFNQKYIVNKIQESLKNGMTSILPDTYKVYISNMIFVSLINVISSKFDIIVVKRSYLVETISNSLLSTDINVLKYQSYVINEMLKDDKSSKRYVEEIKQLINEINKSVLMKKELVAGTESSDSYKYNDIGDFIELLKTVHYDEFISGLDVSFYKDIVYKFYLNISESVNLKRPDMRNIYYQRQVSFSTWKLAIIMVIITLILFLIRYGIGIGQEYSNIFYLSPVRECDKPYAERDFKNRVTNWWIKMFVPPFVALFVIAMLIAYYKKMKAKYEFNLDIIETNTNQLKNLLEDFSDKIDEIDQKLDNSDKTKTIELISKITNDDKKDIFEFIKKIIEKFDKCNYILEAAKNELPFPYTEVVLNGFFMSISILCIVYVWFNYAPVKRFVDNKYLYKMKAELQVTDDLNQFDLKLKSLSICHNDEMDGVVFSMKIIFFMFIIMFLVFYSVKIISSANDFKGGLFNSFYYDESICYDG